ncbi:MAG: hypothetical protein SGI77_10360 [Pirellulaceae bacterium]|nr:hypothetical protein [Pirellulaceae bacterium]
MVTCILKRFGELISVLEGQAPDVVQNRVELLHGRVKRLAADVIADLQPRIALSEDGEPQVESQNNDMLDIRGSKVGMIYGPVGHVEQVDDGSPKLVIYSPRWKEIQERINDAIVNRRGFVGPGCRSYSAGNLEVLDNLLDGMTQGELSYSSNQTVTP